MAKLQPLKSELAAVMAILIDKQNTQSSNIRGSSDGVDGGDTPGGEIFDIRRANESQKSWGPKRQGQSGIQGGSFVRA